MSIHRVVSVVVLTALVVLSVVSVPLAGAQEGPTSDPNDPLIAFVLDWWDTVMVPSEPVSQETAAPYASSTLIYHDPGTPMVGVDDSGVVYYLDWANEERRTMSDRTYTLNHIVRYGDLVWGQMTGEGSLQKLRTEGWAVETLSRLQLPVDTWREGVWIYRLEDGEIAEAWEYLDDSLVWSILQNLICSGWDIPLAASDLYPTDVATVEDHVLLMEGDKIALVRQFFDRTINTSTPTDPRMFNYTVALHNPRGPEVWNLPPRNIRPWFAAMHEMMPDFQMEIQHIVEYDDIVWVHWRSAGTLTNLTTYPGLLKINSLEMPRQVEAEGIYLFRFEDDKIAEWWWYEDNNLLTIAGGDLCFATLM